MDSRVLRRFLRHLFVVIAWSVLAIGSVAGIMFVSVNVTGDLRLVPIIVGILFIATLGCYILWHYSHQEIRHEDLHVQVVVHQVGQPDVAKDREKGSRLGCFQKAAARGAVGVVSFGFLLVEGAEILL